MASLGDWHVVPHGHELKAIQFLGLMVRIMPA
jgi:hypothetical protein